MKAKNKYKMFHTGDYLQSPLVFLESPVIILDIFKDKGVIYFKLKNTNDGAIITVTYSEMKFYRFTPNKELKPIKKYFSGVWHYGN